MIGSFRALPRNVRRTVVRAIRRSASSDRRDDREVVAVLQRRLETGAEANVFVIPVDVDNLPQLPLVVVESPLEAWEFLIQLLQCLRNVGGIDFDDGRAAGELAKRARYPNFDRHGLVIISKVGGPALIARPLPSPYLGNAARPVPSPACGGGQGGGSRLRGANDRVL